MAAIAYAVQRIIDRRRGLIATSEPASAPEQPQTQMAGLKCPECGAHAMIRKDGCDYCTACGATGSCG